MNILKFLFLILILRKNKPYLIYTTFFPEPRIGIFKYKQFIFFPHLGLKFIGIKCSNMFLYRWNIVRIKKLNKSELALELI